MTKRLIATSMEKRVSSVNLQPLFGRPILEQEELKSGCDNQGSFVFRVRTSQEDVIARAFRRYMAEHPFWRTLRLLFGINPLVTRESVTTYTFLVDISPIPVPNVLQVGVAEEREWLVVQLMEGRPLKDFNDLSDVGLLEFGRNLGSIHARRFATLGNPSGSIRFAPYEFPHRLANAFRYAVGNYYAGTRLSGMLDEMCKAATELRLPVAGALVMPDISPGQFLKEGGRIAAMIDVDAYVVGPRELDLVCLEFFIDDRAAALISKGYSEICPLPQLEQVRFVYRYLFRLLDMIPGHVEEWLSWPRLFT